MVLPGNPAGPAAPPSGGALGKLGSGVGGVIVKFVIPVAGFFGGYSIGLGIVQPLADFLMDFIPFLKRMDKSVTTRSTSLKIPLLIAALIIVGVTLTIGYLIRSFMGGGFWGTFIAVGVGAFGVGVGIRGIIEGFGPAKRAAEVVAGT